MFNTLGIIFTMRARDQIFLLLTLMRLSRHSLILVKTLCSFRYSLASFLRGQLLQTLDCYLDGYC